MRRLAILTCALALFSGALTDAALHADAADTDEKTEGAAPSEDEVAALVEALGSDAWAERERAQRRLVELGDAAREALDEALDHEDPEVRARASEALVRIGESWRHAIGCAQSAEPDRSRHGHAALSRLLLLDDDKVLVRLSQQELRGFGGFGGRSRVETFLHPPAVSLARVEGQSGFGLVVDESAEARWTELLSLPSLRIQLYDIERMDRVKDGLTSALNDALGLRGAKDALVFHAMRLGRRSFFFVTSLNERNDPVRRCRRRLQNQWIAGGIAGARAAELLGAGLSSSPRDLQAFHREFLEAPEPGPLYWLAAATDEGSPEVAAEVARGAADEAVALLGGCDFAAQRIGLHALSGLPAERRSELLLPSLETGTNAFEVMAAAWGLRGCPLSASARARALKLAKLDAGNEGPALAAFRLFAFDPAEPTPEEIAALWEALPVRTLSDAMLDAGLTWIEREDVRPGLVEKARQALESASSTELQRGLAAAVLRLDATEKDRLNALKVLRQCNSKRVVGLVARLFEGEESLGEEVARVVVEGIQQAAAALRRRFQRLLRALGPELRKRLATEAWQKLADAANESESTDAMQARLALEGILAGMGDDEHADNLLLVVQGNRLDRAEAAGAALVDAFDRETLYRTLEGLRTKVGVPFGSMAAAEGYAELCQRAVEQGDGPTFHDAYGRALTAAGDNSYRLANRLQELMSQLPSDEAPMDAETPPLFVLSSLEIAP